MSRIALCSGDMNSRATYLQNKDLPNNYMGDFSLMGFIVDRYLDAIVLLTSEGYQLAEVAGGADIVIDSPTQLQVIQQLLREKDIACDIADIADSLYQA